MALPWASEADVRDLTGATVDLAMLVQAQGVVELFVGISSSNRTELCGGNARMLRAAVAYQAAWMASQVDVTGRMEVDRVSQDGVSIEPAHADAMILAPLAKRALDRLSWRRRSSVQMRRCAQPAMSIEAYEAAWLADTEPSGGRWRTL